MGITGRHILYDILGDLRQIYDDADLSPYRVYYWICVFADRLKRQHIAKISSGAFVTRFDNVPVLVDPVNGRHYITIPNVIYDMDEDKSINYITYSDEWYLMSSTTIAPDYIPEFADVTFTRTTPAESARLYFRSDEEPAPANPYFYRQGDRLYFLGTEDLAGFSSVEIGLNVAFDPTDLSLDLDAPFEFPQDLIPVLKRQIFDLGRFILMVPSDLKNDGSGLQGGQIPTQKIVSVNEQPEQNVEQNGY
jgi:hypothetical protein